MILLEKELSAPIEALCRKFTKLKERDKGLVRLMIAKLAQATS